jgi:ATP-binding protein involved in chromosome partitioning
MLPENCLIPLTNYGLKSMSMGYLLPSSSANSSDATQNPGTSLKPEMDTTPISWRGLMVTKAMHQLLHSVSWAADASGGGTAPPLDILILDLPPGTGDVQLTINQEIVLDGAVIVSTPQDIALRDAVRGYGMFQRMDVPVLGMVRNMAYFACPHCGKETKIFSSSRRHQHGNKTDISHETLDSEEEGVVAQCRRLGIDFLGDIPLDARVCEDADRGVPTVVAEENDERSTRRNAFMRIAKEVAAKVGLEWR